MNLTHAVVARLAVVAAFRERAAHSRKVADHLSKRPLGEQWPHTHLAMQLDTIADTIEGGRAE